MHPTITSFQGWTWLAWLPGIRGRGKGLHTTMHTKLGLEPAGTVWFLHKV